MARGMRSDLEARMIEAHDEGACLVPTSPQDAQRLRRALARGEVVSPAPQIYALPDVWETLNPREQELFKIRALAELHPDWVFAGVSAAAAYGLSVSFHMFGKTQIATSSQAHSRSSSDFARSRIYNDVFTQVNGINVTSLPRTVFDCTREATFPDGLAIADSALRVSGMSRDDMLDALRSINSRHAHAHRCIEIAEWADGRAENGGESYARAVIISQGFMLPELQVEVPDLLNAHDSYRVDFYWKLPSGDVAGELDGREKYRNTKMTKGKDIVDVLADERLRESRLTGLQAKVLRFAYRDVLNVQKFSHLLTSYGIPSGFYVPPIARR